MLAAGVDLKSADFPNRLYRTRCDARFVYTAIARGWCLCIQLQRNVSVDQKRDPISKPDAIQAVDPKPEW